VHVCCGHDARRTFTSLGLSHQVERAPSPKNPSRSKPAREEEPHRICGPAVLGQGVPAPAAPALAAPQAPRGDGSGQGLSVPLRKDAHHQHPLVRTQVDAQARVPQ
jgi:hypothetical protein